MWESSLYANYLNKRLVLALLVQPERSLAFCAEILLTNSPRRLGVLGNPRKMTHNAVVRLPRLSTRSFVGSLAAAMTGWQVNPRLPLRQELAKLGRFYVVC